jgi:hypothetical protein
MMIVTKGVVDQADVEEFDGDNSNDDNDDDGDNDDANATSVWHITSSDIFGWCVGVVL